MSNKTSCFNCMNLAIAFFLFVTSALANRNNFVKHDTTGKEGIIIQNNKFSKQFSVLIRDTTLSGNRFDYRWHVGPDSNGFVSPNSHLLPAYLVDSTLSVRVDSILLNNPVNTLFRITSYPRHDIEKLVKNFIRLFVGYIDDKGNLNVVVQFVTPKEFKKEKSIYSKELFLVVPRKELHFAVVQFKTGEYE